MNTNDAARQTTDDLASRVAALERRTSDLALKGQILGSVFGQSGIDRFFAEPEFWENTYDSGQADCARRCIDDNTAARKACAQITDPTDQAACYADALQRVTACQAACVSSFPTPIP